ncbi:hypothetical protein CR513_32931, partial [Mucuna pruriens]
MSKDNLASGAILNVERKRKLPWRSHVVYYLAEIQKISEDKVWCRRLLICMTTMGDGKAYTGVWMDGEF